MRLKGQPSGGWRMSAAAQVPPQAPRKGRSRPKHWGRGKKLRCPQETGKYHGDTWLESSAQESSFHQPASHLPRGPFTFTLSGETRFLTGGEAEVRPDDKQRLTAGFRSRATAARGCAARSLELRGLVCALPTARGVDGLPRRAGATNVYVHASGFQNSLKICLF